MNTREEHAEQAASLLVNYFEAIAKKAGMKWDSDYTLEIREAVDRIIDASVVETLAELKKRP